ncbi:YchJ family protein [Ignatzschineria sp. LJL83]
MTNHNKLLKSRLKKACPCQSGKHYQMCCYPLHNGEAPSTAEQLMRSRFSAFAFAMPEYLMLSWHSTTRPKEGIEEDPSLQWFYLKILKTEAENEKGESFVTFEARYRDQGEVGKLIERSRFVVEEGMIKYLDGEF